MTTAERIPLDVLLGNPEKIQPQISPNGEWLSYIAPLHGVLNVFVGPVGAPVGSDSFRPATNDTDRGILTYGWCHDGEHIYYTQDTGGDENWHLFTVHLESGETVDRTPFDGIQANVIAHRKHFPHEVLIGINKDNVQLHDVYHLDLRTGLLEKRFDNPGFLVWLVDNDLKVRGALAPQPDGGYVILVRDTEDDDWRPFLTVTGDDMLSTAPITFTADGSAMYLRSSIDANAGRLVRQDIASGDIEVIAEDPTYDVVAVMIHPDTREPQVVAFQKEKVEWLVLDPSVAEDVDAIKKLHHGDLGLDDRDHADRTWLVSFDDDSGPLKYYLYDRATRQSTFLFDHRPELNNYTLAAMEPFSFKARDGLEVHGYLSFPPGAERANLPTVMNVHGGPWARDAWGFYPDVQWIANRGYLCVQVNFRGSTGYGKDFANAGDKEWGRKMQNDLTDAVRWVIDQGYTDPERVCIYGWSYGGYASLAGATFTPDLFRCAISCVGPSNLKTFIETIPEYWKPQIALMHTRVGNPETEEGFLWSRSPLSKVDDIRIPMLIAHGANDPRVKLSETEQITAAMREKGIDHELLVFDDEGHGFQKPENRLRFFEAAERFLEKHL